MKVSVIIPVHDRAHLVERAIGSVLAQTCPAHEVIVVDDGSTDGLAEVIAARFDGLVHFVRQANGGAGSARNRGIDIATGDWIAFLDSDDWWDETRIASAAEALEADPSIEFMQANRLHVAADGSVDDGLKASPETLRDRRTLLSGFMMKTSAVMIERDLVERLRLRFPIDQKTCEDYHVFWRAVLFAKSIGFTARPDVKIRLLPESLSRAHPPVYLMNDNIKTLIEVLAWAKTHRADDRSIQALTEHLHWQFRNYFVHLMKSGSMTTLWRYARLSARHEGRWRVTTGLLSAVKGLAAAPRGIER